MTCRSEHPVRQTVRPAAYVAPSLCARLSRERLLALAVRTYPPRRLAETFAAHAGQFYNRSAFDQLACETAALYQANDADQAEAFRRRLDSRLEQREHGVVPWPANTPSS